MKITFGIETITPQDAERILKESASAFAEMSVGGGYRQRRINDRVANVYAKDIVEGRWKENGETIKFDTEGRLLDGQHRLAAVIKANRPVAFFVVRGLDNSVMDTIDYGYQRTLESALQFQCRSYENGAAAVVRKKAFYDRNRTTTGHSSLTSNLSQTELVEEYSNNESDYIEATRYGKEICATSGRRMTASEVGGLYMHLTKTLGYSEVIVKEFFRKLCEVRISDKSIYKTTMDRLTEKGRRSDSLRTIAYYRCWNSMCRGAENRIYADGNTWFIKPTK